MPKFNRYDGRSSRTFVVQLAGDPSLKVVFAAGGTGGHVFPAIAIADALTSLHPSTLVEFVGTNHRLESSAVPRAGYIFRPIPASGLRRPFFSPHNLLLPFQLIISLCVALRWLLEFRPHVVVGTGGYVSGPICIAAVLCGCPIVIQEQNAFPGLANKILARFATTVFVAFAAALTFLPRHKSIVCGNPIRPTLQQIVPKESALAYFFPNWPSALAQLGSTNISSADQEDGEDRSRVPANATPVVILVLGGSLGAKSINQAMIGMVIRMLDQSPERFVIWQTGSKYFKEVLDIVGSHERLFISEFLDHMELAYSATDLVVSRSGAITCSELLILGKPSILIPSSNVVDDHQAKNAAALMDLGASKVLSDNGMTPNSLEAAINEVLGDRGMMLIMHEKALQATAPDAAIRIAKEILSIAKRSALKKDFKRPLLNIF